MNFHTTQVILREKKKKVHLLAPNKMNREMLSKMLKGMKWKVKIFHYAHVMLEPWSYRLHENGTLNITWMSFLKVCNDQFIFKNPECNSTLTLPDRWQGSGKAKIRTAGTKIKLAAGPLPLHANPLFSLIIQQSKKEKYWIWKPERFPMTEPWQVQMH